MVRSLRSVKMEMRGACVRQRPMNCRWCANLRSKISLAGTTPCHFSTKPRFETSICHRRSHLIHAIPCSASSQGFPLLSLRICRLRHWSLVLLSSSPAVVPRLATHATADRQCTVEALSRHVNLLANNAVDMGHGHCPLSQAHAHCTRKRESNSNNYGLECLKAVCGPSSHARISKRHLQPFSSCRVSKSSLNHFHRLHRLHRLQCYPASTPGPSSPWAWSLPTPPMPLRVPLRWAACTRTAKASLVFLSCTVMASASYRRPYQSPTNVAPRRLAAWLGRACARTRVFQLDL